MVTVIRPDTEFRATVTFVFQNADGSRVALTQRGTSAADVRGIVSAHHVVTMLCPTCEDEMEHCPDIRRLLGA